MRFLAAATLLLACTTASGCATALLGVATVAGARLGSPSAASGQFAQTPENYSPPATSDLAEEFVALAGGEGPAASDKAVAAQYLAGQQPVEPDSEIMIAEDEGEVIPTPDATFEGPFKPREDESDLNRFNRPVGDVPLDIRPTQGAMPVDLAGAAFAEDATGIDARHIGDGPPVFCSYTPWTICFRPLYFEEVCVERYGDRVPFFQSAISGAHFFSNVALLPYNMKVRPPRACKCSNGFSRCGDPMPCGYNDCVWRWDAALVEAAAVTGFVFILP